MPDVLTADTTFQCSHGAQAGKFQVPGAGKLCIKGKPLLTTNDVQGIAFSTPLCTNPANLGGPCGPLTLITSTVAKKLCAGGFNVLLDVFAGQTATGLPITGSPSNPKVSAI